MKVLFILCEGPHDAQFVGRLITESKHFTPYEKKLQDYPSPLGSFFQNTIKNQSVEKIRLGKPDFPYIPLGAYISNSGDVLALPISMGGMTKYKEACNYINDIFGNFDEEVLKIEKSPIELISILIMYDADSRGKKATTNIFLEKFKDIIGEAENDISEKWMEVNNKKISLFVFTGDDGETGVLEDTILSLFKTGNHEFIKNIESNIDSHFEPIPENGDKIAYEAKKKKAILTSCGQLESNLAGAALTVVIRDTTLLKEKFDFSKDNSVQSQLLNRINTI